VENPNLFGIFPEMKEQREPNACIVGRVVIEEDVVNAAFLHSFLP
jgi:hypothetical protein